jgi:hypothetical protein
MGRRKRKIRMDRGDTLGGTVPLLLRDRVTPNGTEGRFLRKDRGGGPGWRTLLVVLLLVVLGTGALWIAYPEEAARLGLPTVSDVELFPMD